jgi:hypothetical protein
VVCIPSTSLFAREDSFAFRQPTGNSIKEVKDIVDMDEEDPDIAAMMGFGSFGGTKKRKYDQTNSPKSKIDASGANSTQLGVRMKPNSDEVSLDFGDDDASISNPTVEAQPQPTQTTARPKGKGKQPDATGLAAFLVHAQTIPDKTVRAEQPSLATTHHESTQNHNNVTFSYGGPPISENEMYALRRGVKDEAGDNAYFLPSFVEDPWEKLEQQQRK